MKTALLWLRLLFLIYSVVFLQDRYRFHFRRHFILRARDSDTILDLGYTRNADHRTHNTQRPKKFDHFSNFALDSSQSYSLKIRAQRVMADLCTCLRHEQYRCKQNRHQCRRTL